MNSHHQRIFSMKIRIMRRILIAGLVLTSLKFFAWYLSHSNAVLTDAMESIINIVAAAFGLFTLIYSARPKDENHPYGHGKMEFFAVGFEGALIFLTGIGMIWKAIVSFIHPSEIHSVDIAIYITIFTAVANYFMGRYLVKTGTRLHSTALSADGQHLISDTVSSGILLGGLAAILITGKMWIDTVLTIGLGIYILFVGFRLLRDSLAGLMDETDYEKVEDIMTAINAERRDNWVDIHNLRVVKYGPYLHIDAHLSLPWYHDLRTTHEEVKTMEKSINRHFENRVEFFIHTDPCLPETQCALCLLANCPHRKSPLKEKQIWTMDLLMTNKPHGI